MTVRVTYVNLAQNTRNAFLMTQAISKNKLNSFAFDNYNEIL